MLNSVALNRVSITCLSDHINMPYLRIFCVMAMILFAPGNSTPVDLNGAKESHLNGATEQEMTKNSPKEKSLYLAEPFLIDRDLDVLPDYEEPTITYYLDGTDGVNKPNTMIFPTINPNDMEVAESNIVFRPLFAYRKQMEKRRRIYLQPKEDKSRKTPSRRGYYYSYGYPLFYQNREFDHVA